MPDPSEAFSTLDDFLLSLADGISHAQQSLARSGVAGPPGRQFTYHLPRVDFELKMNLRVVEDERLTARYRDIRPERPSSKHLLFKPLSVEESSSTLEIGAVIKGAFVAVPANDGLPGAVIETTLVPTADARVKTVRVVATNAAGEPLPGLDVQFNLDREESAALTTASSRTLVIAAGTGFTHGVVTTDDTGVAEAEFRLDAAQQPGSLVLIVDAAEHTEQLVLEVTA